MFGYVRAYKPELRIKEYEMYKAVYCSLCRELGHNFGIAARLTLSYDFTFLALLKLSLNDEFCGTVKGKCAFNPLKKCNYCKNGKDFEFTTAAAIVMLYYKLLDNIKDETGIKKLGYKILKPRVLKAFKKAEKMYPQLKTVFENYVSLQNKIEHENIKNIDAAAEPTAAMLASMFSMLSGSETEKRVLNRLGYCIGRYIYILDAALDYNADVKKNRYNPFNSVAQIRQRAEILLYQCINEATLAFDLLPAKRFKDILGNIVTLGLENTFKTELAKEYENEKSL